MTIVAIRCPERGLSRRTVMQPIEAFCCQNPNCPDHGKRGARNLRPHGFSGKTKVIRLFHCRTCGVCFSERKGTAFFYGHLPVDKALAVLAHIQEGCGVRATARLVGVDKNTVMRYAKLAGDHAKALHDELVAFSPRNA